MSGKFWTEAEDKRLLAARELGLTWQQIATEYLPGRTPDSVSARHRSIFIRSKQPRPVVLNFDKPGYVRKSERLTETKIDPSKISGTAPALFDALSMHGCEQLWSATQRLYEREAARTGQSVTQVAMWLQNRLRVDERGVLAA